jgi:AbrB family looped-hinge helix DNA binding protein
MSTIMSKKVLLSIGLDMRGREMSIVKVTRKGQMTIPQETRERLGIREGDYLVATEVDDLVILRKITLPSWDELFAHGERFAAEEGITGEDIPTAIRAVRRGT